MRLKASEMLARERERKDRKWEKRHPLILDDTGLADFLEEDEVVDLQEILEIGRAAEQTR
jgi:hypothetical protein